MKNHKDLEYNIAKQNNCGRFQRCWNKCGQREVVSCLDLLLLVFKIGFELCINSAGYKETWELV